jgi:hypothetical protein
MILRECVEAKYAAQEKTFQAGARQFCVLQQAGNAQVSRNVETARRQSGCSRRLCRKTEMNFPIARAVGFDILTIQTNNKSNKLWH